MTAGVRVTQAVPRTCRLYGLHVASPFVLGHIADEVDRPDIRISVGDGRMSPDEDAVSRGRLLAGRSPGRPDYRLLDRGPEGYFYRIRDFVDIDISPDQRVLQCRLAEGASEEMLPVMLTGHLLSTLLLLRGELVFHASAVEMDGAAFAFVGNSGAGKSTLAAIACRLGGRLVTDDVLRAVPTATGTRCYRGGASLRLRPDSKALAESATASSNGGVSADGRHLLVPEPTPLDELRLAAVFVPRLLGPDTPLVRTALSPRSALLTLLQFPRVQSWTDPDTSAAHFDKLATMVQQVPVYSLDVPWGVPIERSWFDRFADLIFSPAPDALGADPATMRP